MKRKSLIIAAFLIFTVYLFPQTGSFKFSLKENSSASSQFENTKSSMPFFKKTDMPTGLFAAGIAGLFINPILVFEDKKIFWGLTKEISIAFFPYGRLNLEYSFLFRTFNKNHIRISYNYDFIEQNRSDWVMYRTSAGAGFFTDTKSNGIFAQVSPGFFIASPIVIFDLYLKYRFTYTFNKNKSDIHDISLGMGLLF